VSLVVHPLTPQRWPDLETLFASKGCSVARGCWCMYYRQSGSQGPLQPGQTHASRNRARLKALAAGKVPPGLIGYRNGVPVGWISLGPREDFAKLERSPVMKPVDARPVWSVVCFVVPSAFRGPGVAAEQLAQAVRWARRRGVRLLEAYPVDLDVEPKAQSLWFGTRSMFDAAGFAEVARRKPGRPVLRLELAGR
jgi:GNAT superfamily N-acetyltransferase